MTGKQSIIPWLIFTLAVAVHPQDSLPPAPDSALPPPPPPTVELSFAWDIKKPADLRAGDTIQLDAVADWVGERDYYTLQVPADPACTKFTVAGKRTSNRVEPEAGGGMRCRTVYTYFLEATEPGSGTIEGLSLLYTSLADGKERTLSVRGTEINIGPRRVKTPWKKIILGITIVLVLGGAGVAFWLRRRKQMREAGRSRGVSLKVGLEQRLQAANQAYNSGDISEYYTQLLKILRDAIKARKLPEADPQSVEAGRMMEKMENLRFSGAPLAPEEIDGVKLAIKRLIAGL